MIIVEDFFLLNLSLKVEEFETYIQQDDSYSSVNGREFTNEEVG